MRIYVKSTFIDLNTTFLCKNLTDYRIGKGFEGIHTNMAFANYHQPRSYESAGEFQYIAFFAGFNLKRLLVKVTCYWVCFR